MAFFNGFAILKVLKLLVFSKFFSYVTIIKVSSESTYVQYEMFNVLQVLSEARDYLIQMGRMSFENPEKEAETRGHIFAPVRIFAESCYMNGP